MVRRACGVPGVPGVASLGGLGAALPELFGWGSSRVESSGIFLDGLYSLSVYDIYIYNIK